MKNNSEIPEVKSLRWLANMFPFTENAKEEEDKMCNAINIYCTAGADKIEELTDIINVLTKQIDILQKNNCIGNKELTSND